MNFPALMFFILLEKLIPVFPLGFLYFIARIKAKFFYYIIPVRKKTARLNLQIAFPDKSSKEINCIIKRSYLNILIVIIEFFYLKKFSAEQLSRKFVITNNEDMRKRFEKGKGIIFISGHFGNWEIMAYGGTFIFGKPINVIVKEQSNRALDKRINRIRETHGNHLIEMKNSARTVFKALSRNEIVAMLGDQSAPAESVKVKFFGKEITAFEGAAAFALKTGAPVFFGVPVRDQDHNYSLEAIEIDTSLYSTYSAENIRALTQKFMSLLEQQIKLHPDHWLWFHRRFKSVIKYR